MQYTSNYPPLQALALNTSTPGLWRHANQDLLTSWRGGPEQHSSAAERDVVAATYSQDRPSLLSDLPELALTAILRQLDSSSLAALGQTCQTALTLISAQEFWSGTQATDDALLCGLRNACSVAIRLPPQILELTVEPGRSTRFPVSCSVYRLRPLLHTSDVDAICLTLTEGLQEIVARAYRRRQRRPEAHVVPGDIIGAIRADRGQVRLSLAPSSVVAAFGLLRGCDWGWAPVPDRVTGGGGSDHMDAIGMREELDQLFPAGSSWMDACPASSTRLHCFLSNQRHHCLSLALERMRACMPEGTGTRHLEPPRHACNHVASSPASKSQALWSIRSLCGSLDHIHNAVYSIATSTSAWRPAVGAVSTIKMLDQLVHVRWELQRDAERLLSALGGLPSLSCFGTCQERDRRLQAVAACAQVKDMSLVLQLRHFMQVVKAACKAGTGELLLDFLLRTLSQHAVYLKDNALQGSGLLFGYQTEVARLAGSVKEACRNDPVQQCDAEYRATISNAMQQHNIDTNSILRCHLQLELLWVLNWSLYLLGVI